MTDNVIPFPGYILLEDRNTILKAGKRYRSTKAMVADLSMEERKATLGWYQSRFPWAVDHRQDHRHRTLHYSVYEPDSKWLHEKKQA
jgi:hypothetical protein